MRLWRIAELLLRGLEEECAVFSGAPVVQRIECSPPKAEIEVQFLAGAKRRRPIGRRLFAVLLFFARTYFEQEPD